MKGTNWNQNDHFMSQELRLNGVTGPVDWLVGAYYYTDDIDVDWQLLYGADFGDYFNLRLGVPAALFPSGKATSPGKSFEFWLYHVKDGSGNQIDLKQLIADKDPQIVGGTSG